MTLHWPLTCVASSIWNSTMSQYKRRQLEHSGRTRHSKIRALPAPGATAPKVAETTCLVLCSLRSSFSVIDECLVLKQLPLLRSSACISPPATLPVDLPPNEPGLRPNVKISTCKAPKDPHQRAPSRHLQLLAYKLSLTVQAAYETSRAQLKDSEAIHRPTSGRVCDASAKTDDVIDSKDARVNRAPF